MRPTVHLLVKSDFPRLRRRRLDTIQVNVGYICNQTCVHCHVNAGPNRIESMDSDTASDVLAFARAGGVARLDITGGAPELNPHFRYMVSEGRALGLEVIDRCNLTVLEEPGQEDLSAFLAANQVEVVASLPCYLGENVDQQRGQGVYDASIRGIRRLNALGYGCADSGLILNLVFNPQGPDLPPPQPGLEADYRRYLGENYGIVFNSLFTLTNMPIQRFGSRLLSKGQFHTYMDLLKSAHCEENLEAVMCRTLISVDWQGYVYDCDFNQMLQLPMGGVESARAHIRDLVKEELEGREIVVGQHCYGCTAGQGSSCGGALAG